MQSLSRRTGLRALCACAASFVLLPRPQAQALPAPHEGLGRTLDPWELAKGHVDRALAMSSSIARSLDSLSANTSAALVQAGKLKEKLDSLGRDLEKFTSEKESLLEEYRNGLFCSGCGQTRSQILAKGETFPHPGQKIIRPTPEQIAAKERELQAPIDRTRRGIDSTQDDLEDKQAKGDAGLAQLRLGTRLWRTATSHAETSVARGSAHTYRAFMQQLQEIKGNLAHTQRVLAAGRGKEAADLAQAEVQTWERLALQRQADLDAFVAASARAELRVAERDGEERRRIMSFIARPELFARVGGPPGVPIHWTATDGEMGSLYLMGRLPDGPYTALPNVQQFIGKYRASGSEFPLAGQLAMPDAAASPQAAPGAPQEVRPAAPAGKLLQALP